VIAKGPKEYDSGVRKREKSPLFKKDKASRSTYGRNRNLLLTDVPSQCRSFIDLNFNLAQSYLDEDISVNSYSQKNKVKILSITFNSLGIEPNQIIM